MLKYMHDTIIIRPFVGVKSVNTIFSISTSVGRCVPG